MLSRRLLRIKVIKALFAHLQSDAADPKASEKTLTASVDKAYDLYFQLLALPVEVARYAAERQETARHKKLPTAEDLAPNTKFVDNRVVRLIAGSTSVGDYLKAHKLGWARQPELIRIVYNRLTESEYYRNYMASAEHSFAADEAFLEAFYLDLQDCEALDTALEEISLLWSGDLPFILMMVVRTLQAARASQNEFRVADKFKSEEDPEFVRTLFRESLAHYEEYQAYIERFTANWDLERIVFMDNLILGVAIAELIAFPSIPVKVTLDEYIEISKYYSTPGSSSFVNGVLDKVVESMTAEGRIQKSGRGLI